MTDEVSDIRAVFERTIAAGTARIEYATELTWKLPKFPEPKRRNAIRQGLIDAGKTVGKGLLRLASRNGDLRRQHAEGFIDLTGRRWMLDYGSYARLQVADEEWGGRSGRTLATLSTDQARATSPLWLIELISGVNGADDHGLSEVDGHQWRHLSITSSLPDAAAAHSGSMPTPARAQYAELLALPLDIWIDRDYLRRIRWDADNGTTTVTLSDFGAAVDDLDWTRLPTFRSPEEESNVERGQGS